jgi:ligand-binding SRPBCC domain-containing protein
VGIEYSTLIDHPRAEVFAWHTRPGAIRRLMPPWQPLTPLKEAESVADGTAVLGLPGGLRWVARHDPEGHRPGRQFVDAMALGSLRPWRHVHEFLDADGRRMLMRDRVIAPVPAAMLRPMFRYRHRQLVDDLAVHREAATMLTGPLTVSVTGLSGIVAEGLCALLSTGGHRVLRTSGGDAEVQMTGDGIRVRAGAREVCVRPGLVVTARSLHRLAGADERVSWVHIDDLTDIVYRALFDKSVSGVVDAAAPQPIRVHEFNRLLRRLRPRTMLTPARRPAGVLESTVPGHRFRHATMAAALRHELGRG